MPSESAASFTKSSSTMRRLISVCMALRLGSPKGSCFRFKTVTLLYKVTFLLERKWMQYTCTCPSGMCKIRS